MEADWWNTKIRRTNNPFWKHVVGPYMEPYYQGTVCRP